MGLWSGRQRPAPRPPRPTQSPCFLHPVICLPSQVPIVLWSRQKPGGRSGLRLKPAMRPGTPALCLPGFLPSAGLWDAFEGLFCTCVLTYYRFPFSSCCVGIVLTPLAPRNTRERPPHASFSDQSEQAAILKSQQI